MIGRGKGTPEIGQNLSSSVKTIETYLPRLDDKPELSSGAERIRCTFLRVENGRIGSARIWRPSTFLESNLAFLS